MTRREFITAISGTAMWPLGTAAQQPTIPVIGLLSGNQFDYLDAIRKGLTENGFVEGRNVAIDHHSANGRYEELPALAMELVRRPVAVIVAVMAADATRAAMAATPNIPIVFSTGSDPVEQNLVSNLNRPGRNVTGVTFLTNMLGAKRLEVLHEAVPNAKTIGVIINPNNPNSKGEMADIRAAAEALNLQIYIEAATTEREIDAAFGTLMRRGMNALMTAADAFLSTRVNQLVDLADRNRIPTIYSNRDSTSAGGLVSYRASRFDAFRLAGVYTARILKGEKPADLPVLQASKFELMINLKTAKALGLDMPAAILARADDVIE